MTLPSFRTAAVSAVFSVMLVQFSGLTGVQAETAGPENTAPEELKPEGDSGAAPESGRDSQDESPVEGRDPTEGDGADQGDATGQAAEATEGADGGDGVGPAEESAEAEPAPAPAQDPVDPKLLAELTDTMQIPDVLAVMAEEGKAYGTSIEEQMFPGKGGPGWEAQVAAIYAPEALMPVFAQAFEAALANDPEAVAAAQAFFSTARGQEILHLEVEARRALLDIAVEEAAQVEAERMKAERDPKLRLVRELIEAGDLIESNVAGALTANLAFYEGMAEVGVAGMPSDLESIMTEVWGQEDGIRTETGNWLVPYMAMAYQPLPEADLKAYVAYSRTTEGKRLNAALFAGFEAVSRQVSYNLGRQAAGVMAGNDI